MVNQKINLYQDKFKPVKIILSAQQMLSFFAILTISLLSFSFYQNNTNLNLLQKYNALEQQQQNLDTINKKLEEKLQKLKGIDNKESKKNDVLIKKIKQHKNILKLLSNQKNFHTKNFSEYLIALSNNTDKGIWLSKIDIEANGSYVKLEGVAQEATLVTKYIDKLSNKASFDKLPFKYVHIEQQKDKPENYKFSLSTKLENKDTVAEHN